MAEYDAQNAGEEPRIEALSRKGLGPMSKSEFASLMCGIVGDCTTFNSECSIERAQATDYYKGRPFGNEEEGRSQVVLTEVRDAILGVLPSLIRVLLGSDYPVEFVATKKEKVEEAAQATEYIRYVFLEDNPGFLNTIAVLKDGLTRKIGIFKWGWDESRTTKTYRLEGVTGDELRVIAADDDVTLNSVVESKDDAKDTSAVEIPAAPANAPKVQAPDAPAGDAVESLYDVELTRVVDGGRAAIWPIPPEEFLWNREARDMETALFVGHRTRKTRGELIAMGYAETLIDEYASGDATGTGASTTLGQNVEEVARRGESGAISDPEMGRANDKIEYVEGYARIDFNGDGIAELRKVCTLGPAWYPVWNKPCSEIPFSVFIPDPEPHTLLGDSWFDRLKPIQKTKSMLLRGALDSLAAAIFPRMTYEEGYASVADMLNTAIGAPIRIRKTGAVQSFAHPFVGKEAMPLIDFFTGVTERRIGRDNGAGGLDSDSLQSMDEQGVKAAISGSQEQAEMLARLFAEGCFKPMFRGLFRLMIEKKPKKRVVRLRGKWTDVDPRSWDANMDVTVNVALGAGFTEKKIMTLSQIATKQQEIIEKYGPSNPICTVAMWRDTVAKITELQGIKDSENYFMPVAPDWQPPPPPPPPPSPEQVMAESNLKAEQIKATRSLAEKKDELALKEKQMDLDYKLKLQQMAHDFEIKKYGIDMQFQQGLTTAQINADVQTDVAETTATIDGHAQLHDQMMAEAEHAHNVNMDTRAADTADATAATAAAGTE